jgi:hypothetical protein
MKRSIVLKFLSMAATLLGAQLAIGQGTLYLSSLSPTSTGIVPVGTDSWLAGSFGSGNNPGGYLLNSIQLSMSDSTGNPGGFTVMLYTEANNPAAVLPGSSVATLTGSANPSSAGVYTYAAASAPSLSPNTTYFIVITSGTSIANGAYNWDESAYPPAVDQWGIFNGILHSGNGTSGWSPTPYLGVPQLAINATAAPEPGVVALLSLGGLVVCWRRWRARPVG